LKHKTALRDIEEKLRRVTPFASNGFAKVDWRTGK